MARKVYKFEYVKLGDVWGQAGSREFNDGGFTLNWAAKGWGFGQLAFVKKGRKTICETETMSQEFIRQAVSYWLKSLEYRDV